MFSFWRKYPELADVILPQKIMRPFWHPQAKTIDNHTFSAELPYERPVLMCTGIFLAALISLAVAGYVIWRHWHTSEPRSQFDNELILALVTGLLALGAGGYLIHLFVRAVPVRYWQLDRQARSVTVPMRSLIPAYFTDDYDQFQAKVLNEINRFGRRRTRLVIEYKKTGQQVCIFVTTDSTNVLVGYWSFIVQYMKAEAPLPDVPALNHFPNTTPGIRRQVTNNYTL